MQRREAAGQKGRERSRARQAGCEGDGGYPGDKLMNLKPNTTAMPKFGVKNARKRSTALAARHQTAIPSSSRDAVERKMSIEGAEPCRPRLRQPTRDSNITFASPEWREPWDRVRRSGHHTTAYIAGCSGTLALGRRLGMPTFKCGTGEDVEARINKLNQQKYGNLVVHDGAFVKEEGFDNWQPSKLSAPPCHPASPVRVLPRALLITLPGWVSVNKFEARFNAALEHVSLVHLAANPVWQDLCRQRDCPIDENLRYSHSARGPVLASEIVVIGPSADTARLVAVIEKMLISIVLGDDPEKG